MNELKAKNYPHPRDITELDYCDPSKGGGSNIDNESIGLSSAGQSSESSEEDVPLSKLHHREHAPATDDEADSNEEEISGADDSDSFDPAEDSAEDEDASGSDESFLLTKKKPARRPRRTAPEKPVARRSQAEAKKMKKKGTSRSGATTLLPATNWTYGSWLMTKSLEELENMKGADLLYLKVMQKNKDKISERMSSMKLADKPVLMTEYPSEAKVQILHQALKEYDDTYDESIRSKGGRSKMKKIDKFFRCSKHSKITTWGMEFKLCGEVGCNLCPRSPRVTKLDDPDLTKEVLGFCPLPRVDVSAEEFLPIDECQNMLDNGDDLAKELKDLRRIRERIDKVDAVVAAKQAKEKRDRQVSKDFNWTKLRFILTCGDCNAPRCVFSQYAVGNAKGPMKKHMTLLEKFVEENGYRCGESVRIYANGEMEVPKAKDDEEEEKPLLFCKEAHVCYNTIESQYYASEGAVPNKGGRVQTKHICCHCYSGGDLADDEYIDERRDDRGGKKYLPICKACVDDGAHLQTRKHARTNKLQEAKGKRKQKALLKAKVGGKRQRKS